MDKLEAYQKDPAGRLYLTVHSGSIFIGHFAEQNALIVILIHM